MTRLELYGLGVAAAMWLEGRAAEGRMLAALIAAEGKPLGLIDLDRLAMSPVASRGADRRVENPRNRVSVNLTRLRVALSDLGFAGAIIVERGVGWRLLPGPAAAIRAEIEARL